MLSDQLLISFVYLHKTSEVVTLDIALFLLLESVVYKRCNYFYVGRLMKLMKLLSHWIKFYMKY